MILFTYKCPEHGDFEKLVKNREKEIECPECGILSKKVFTNCKVHYNALGFSKNNNYGG